MRDLLRSVWDEPRPADVPGRVWRDWVLLVALVVVAVLEGALRPELRWPIVQVLVMVALAPTLMWRRTRPLLAVTIAFVGSSVVPALAGRGPWLNALAFLLILVYALFRWGSGREIVIGSAIILGKLCVPATLGYLSVSETVTGTAVVSAVAAVGTAVRYRAAVRMRELDQAKLLERERLARDLHDTVAHHVSAIAIRAQAGLAVAASQPEVAVDALRVIEAEAARTLAEMRAMVHTLRRHDPVALESCPLIRDLERLAIRSGAGPSVDVELVGDLDLPPPVATAIYRLAQESVTNARRHARHATRVKILVLAEDTAVHLIVSDDGHASPMRTATSTGYGLIGMTERAGLLGGTLRAGPGPDRGWRVTATLPRTGPA